MHLSLEPYSVYVCNALNITLRLMSFMLMTKCM